MNKVAHKDVYKSYCLRISERKFRAVGALTHRVFATGVRVQIDSCVTPPLVSKSSDPSTSADIMAGRSLGFISREMSLVNIRSRRAVQTVD